MMAIVEAVRAGFSRIWSAWRFHFVAARYRGQINACIASATEARRKEAETDFIEAVEYVKDCMALAAQENRNKEAAYAEARAKAEARRAQLAQERRKNEEAVFSKALAILSMDLASLREAMVALDASPPGDPVKAFEIVDQILGFIPVVLATRDIDETLPEVLAAVEGSFFMMGGHPLPRDWERAAVRMMCFNGLRLIVEVLQKMESALE